MSPTPELGPDPTELDVVDPHPLEIEFKFGIDDPAAISRLIADPPPGGLAGFLPSGPSARTTEVDRYMDTAAPVGLLFAAGLRARLRAGERGVILAVKQRGVVDGSVTTRVELEGAATPDLDPGAWPESTARRRLVETIGEQPLVEVAAVRQRRLKRHFRRGPVEVELSLDEMEALDGDEIVGSRCEFEVELVAGPAAALEELAGALRELPGVMEAIESKLTFALSSRSAARTTFSTE
jgi:inorganic triphosphatase YgiF